MSDSNHNEDREKHAFDAIIVSNLLRDRNPSDPKDLPELTESMKAKMHSVPNDLIRMLWEDDSEETEEACEEY